jgi:hypothetical protein
MATDLENRLGRIDKRQIGNEHYSLISDYILIPMLPQLVEERAVLHKATYNQSQDQYRNAVYYGVNLEFEREKRRGWRNAWARFFCPWQTGLTINYADALFACTYYDYRYFQYTDEIKSKYYELLYPTYGINMVIVGKDS